MNFSHAHNAEGEANTAKYLLCAFLILIAAGYFLIAGTGGHANLLPPAAWGFEATPYSIAHNGGSIAANSDVVPGGYIVKIAFLAIQW